MHIFVSAGEPSGDLHAANLIKALREKDPEITVTAMGGVRMQEVSTHFIYNLVSVGAVGFSAPLMIACRVVQLSRAGQPAAAADARLRADAAALGAEFHQGPDRRKDGPRRGGRIRPAGGMTPCCC